jgi:hypothetical protein
MVVDGVVVQPEEYVLVVQVGENDERLQAARVSNGRRLVASRGSKTAGNADVCDSRCSRLDSTCHILFAQCDIALPACVSCHVLYAQNYAALPASVPVRDQQQHQCLVVVGLFHFLLELEHHAQASLHCGAKQRGAK